MFKCLNQLFENIYSKLCYSESNKTIISQLHTPGYIQQWKYLETLEKKHF